jgi:hypothetical protein
MRQSTLERVSSLPVQFISFGLKEVFIETKEWFQVEYIEVFNTHLVLHAPDESTWSIGYVDDREEDMVRRIRVR